MSLDSEIAREATSLNFDTTGASGERIAFSRDLPVERKSIYPKGYFHVLSSLAATATITCTYLNDKLLDIDHNIYRFLLNVSVSVPISILASIGVGNYISKYYLNNSGKRGQSKL